MYKIFFCLSLILSASPALCSSAKISMTFKYEKTDLRVQLFSVKPELTYSVSRTGLVKSLDKTPADKLVSGPIELTDLDNSKTFVLVAENKTSDTKYFFATPYTISPELASLSTIFECFCNHHVYQITPKHFWYRIIKLKYDFNNTASKNIELKSLHNIIEVSEKKALSEYKNILYEQID